MAKRKILFTINHLEFSNGVCNVLLELANALDKAGYDITVMPVFLCDDEFCKKFNDGVKIKICFGNYFRGMARLVRLLPQKALYKRFVKDEYDIEVAFQCDCSTSILAASTDHKAKHIAWMHGYDERDKKWHRAFDKIVACAKSTCEEYKRVFSQPEKVTYLYNLVDENRIIAVKDAPIDIKKKYDFTFCTVGRLSPEKGFMRLLQAHKKLIDDGLFHNLWIVGEGAEHEKLQKYIDDENLSDSIKLFGFDSNPYKYMYRSDMFVCSSFSEGMSTVCTEALLLGVPVISTRVNGADEIISDNKCGIVVDNNETALYEGMKNILTNRDCVSDFKENISRMNNLKYADRLSRVKEFFDKI